MTTTRREMKGQASPAAPEGAQQPPQQAQQAPAQTPQKQKVIEQLEDPALHPPPLKGATEPPKQVWAACRKWQY
eukprot:1152073-Pelagomonas_calceolata.AAC.2